MALVANDAGLERFNALSAAEAREGLRSCCACADWVGALASGRPYPHRAGLLDRAGRELAALAWPAVIEALDAHPRIGDRPAGQAREDAWSRQEQSGVQAASAQARAALAAANRAYEQRFGHVFLIFATGRSDVEVLAAARERLGNDEATERRVVRAELGRIVELRLRKLLDS